MDKWADYLISEVNYDSEHLISIAIRHQDTGKEITKGEPVDRLTIASDIKNGLFYITIYSKKNSWKKGYKINTFSIGGTPYLRLDKNKVNLDNLGDLPEVLIVKSDYVAEPENEEATPEQIARLEQLEQQIRELESKPEPVAEPENEEATPEQIDDLREQIRELETMLSSKLHSSLDTVTKQSSQIKELKNDIKKIETNVEQKIIQTLQKQNKKLDNIEQKIHDSLILENNSLKSTLSTAYCFKCKTKRKIKNIEEIVMKNGRDAIRGFCSVCDCKVFRIGKLKK